MKPFQNITGKLNYYLMFRMGFNLAAMSLTVGGFALPMPHISWAIGSFAHARVSRQVEAIVSAARSYHQLTSDSSHVILTHHHKKVVDCWS